MHGQILCTRAYIYIYTQRQESCPKARHHQQPTSTYTHRCIHTYTYIYIPTHTQESPGDIPEGETPQTVNLCAFEDLVDVCKPGDRVQVTGIYRAMPMRVKATQRSLKAVYKTFIDVIHFNRFEKGR
jgi:DNA replicative helicase MCM subunit Mcm2 (Cdc46/Mcm family)